MRLNKYYKKHSLFLILVLILPSLSFSQNEFLDYAVNQNNDTIYGTIRNMISERSIIYELNSNPKKDRIKFRIHKLKKFKKIRYNDIIYTYEKPYTEDGIYSKETYKKISEDSILFSLGNFKTLEKRLPDYVITNTNDTVFGKIKDPALDIKLHLLDSANTKFKIENEKIKGFRYNNEVFERKEQIIEIIPFFRKKSAYLKLILDGKIKLYEFDSFYNKELDVNPISLNYNQSNFNSVSYEKKDNQYFIEKDNELIPINNYIHKKKLVDLFSDNQTLVSKILNKEYIIDNIYLMVKYYNESK